MKGFIESVLHQKIELIPYEELEQFPLSLRGSYDLYQMSVTGQQCILAVPKEEMGLSELRRQQKRIEQITGLYCVLYIKKLNYYSRDKMLEEGIPFIWENKQVYMPFLGMLLRQNETREIRPCAEISYLAQKLLLTALYEEWDGVTVTEAAKRIGVSKMSITRVFDELECMDSPVLVKKGRTRKYVRYGTKKEVWAVIEPILRDPLLEEYYLEENIAGRLIKSGISGLAEMSMLEDEPYPTYGVTKYEVRKIGIERKWQIPKGENPGCVVQKLGYCIPFQNGDVIDPLTIYLLMKRKIGDPRIDMALDEMLEEYVW